MIVMCLTDCPVGLRGDLTKWLLEISSGVFVGQATARVRDELWDRVKEMSKNGRATLVYSAQGEQRLDFRVHGDVWEPIDFDGIKLMLRPSPSRLKALKAAMARGFSDAAKRRVAKRFSGARGRYPADYVALDIVTTGNNPETDEILGLNAIKVAARETVGTFSSVANVPGSVQPGDGAPPSDADGATRGAHSDGKALEDMLIDFFGFASGMPIVAHGIDANIGFLLNGCMKSNLPLFVNRCIDTLPLARRAMQPQTDYMLETIAGGLGIEHADRSHGLAVCETTRDLYEKLMDLMDTGSDK